MIVEKLYTALSPQAQPRNQQSEYEEEQVPIDIHDVARPQLPCYFDTWMMWLKDEVTGPFQGPVFV